MNSNIKRDRASLLEQFKRQRNYLRRSCELFDQGAHEEAVRIATVIRTLLHDTKSSKSLLKQLDLKYCLRFLDTGVYEDRLSEALNRYAKKVNPSCVGAAICISDLGLVTMCTYPDGTAGWCPPLNTQRFHPEDPKSEVFIPPQPFQEWWTTPLVRGSSGRKFSRKDLVCIMANQDGGAHVDPTLDAGYNDLSTDDLGARFIYGSNLTFDVEPPSVKNNITFASVRQIGYEVENTLDICQKKFLE